jgi:hypothetical protein
MDKTTLLLKLTFSEKAQIEVLAKKEGKTTSDYLRTKALNN